MKQTKLLLATIATLWCSLTASAHDFAVGGIYYNITSEMDLTVEVTYRGSYYNSYSNEYSGAVTIPSAVTYNGKTYSVASIEYSAFRDCSSLTSITIPESVTSIGWEAFYGTAWYDNLPDGVIYINKVLYTYKGTMPENTSIEVKEGTISISPYAFEYCRSLTSITIPESVTSIGNGAFNGCTSLKELVIEDGNETLSLGYTKYNSKGKGLFYDCPLETIYLGRNLSYDNDYQHGYSPFYNKKALTSVTIGEGVTSIGSSAFWDCTSLTSITIPEGVTSIGSSAFSGCTSLTSIIVEGGNTTYDSRDNCNAIIETSGNCLIVGCSTTIIPEGVTSIGYEAFRGCSSLTSITIPESVTSIGMYAFYNCSNLTSITIPERVTSIGSYAFYNCSSLTAITIPKSSQLTWIGKYAFWNCNSLTSITIPEGVTSIGNFAFVLCTSLKELVIEDGSKTLSLGYNKYYDNVDYYGPGLFYDCPLETIYLGRNLSYDSGKSYGYSPFYNQKALTSVTIGESVTSIQDYAFYNCSSLTAIIIPESVTSIGLYAFSGTAWYDNQPDGVIYINKVLYTYKGTMPANTSIEVKEGTEYIANRAFDGCSSLTAITIPESVTSIGNWAFSDCSSLTAVHIKDIASWCNIDFDGYSANPLYYAKNLYLNGELVTELTIPNTATAIKDYAFFCCSSLTSITIPESVTSIGREAFDGCRSLTSITIPENVTSIENYAFNGCTSLKELVIEDGNETLSLGYNEYYSNKIESLFYDCPLETIYLGRNLSYSSGKSYGYSPFYNQKALTSVTIGESVTEIGDYAFRDCSSLISITIPESVTEIGDYAFCDCSSLTSITIPENSKLRSIGESTFRGCSSLPSIAIPESVTSIGREAFDGCRSLTSITIPESVTSIGNYAFCGCTSLKELVIADGSETLSLGYNMYDYNGTGEGLFYDCPLETIYLGRNLSYINNYEYGYSPFYNQNALTSVTIGESVTSIGGSAFRDCRSLTAVHIKDITSWCNIDFSGYNANPLYYAKNLYLNGELVTELTIPNTVTAIKDYVFSGCRNLSSITIPESVTSIGSFAFYDCTSLKELVIADGNGTLSLGYNYYNSSSNKIGEGLFYDCPLETIYLGRNLSYSSGSKYGYSPFYNQKVLTSVTIGESVTSIGEIAFYNCSSLTAVHIKDIASWCNINFSDYIANPLYYAKNLYLNGELVTELTIPNTVTAIKRYAFYGCSRLTSITIPESVTSIGDDSFSGCSNVENLVVKGSAMPHVPSDKLKKIVLYSPAPLQSKGFSATVYQNCMLYVPQQGLARYQIVEPWAYFWNIIAFDTSDIAPAELPEEDSAPIIYDLRGQRVDVPTRGNIYIVNGRKVLY